MSIVRIPGGAFVPKLSPGAPAIALSYVRGNFGTLDADQKEMQFIGNIYLEAGSGSKTFGTSSKIGFLPGGGSVQLVAVATLRCGVKKASSIDTANGPPARATIGASAFDVYKDLVGGTDTVSAVTWKDVSMDSGTPFTVTHGDQIAVCFLLSVTSGTQLINFSAAFLSSIPTQNPTGTLVTSGPTYTNQACVPNLIVTFDDGTEGWIDGSFVSSANPGTTNVGNTNIYGNVVNFPVDCQVDALTVLINTSSTTSYDVGFWSTPGTTPTPITGGTISFNPRQMGATSAGWQLITLPAPITLSANTDYFMAVKQNSATAVTIGHYDVNAAADLAVSGLSGTTCYAALSTAGGAVVAANSGKRRASIYARIYGVPDGSGGSGGGSVPIIGTGVVL